MRSKRSRAPKEVFLSHSSRDLVFGRRLAETLAKKDIKTFFSPKQIQGAQEWHDEIGSALQRCDWFLLVLSPSSVESWWVKHELLFALQASRYQNRIVPIFYKNCDAEKLSWVLSAIQHIDFRKDFHSGCRELLRLWGLAYLRPKFTGASAKRRR